MFSFTELNEIQVIAFGLILLRMIGFVFSAAVFNSPTVPVSMRILFSLVLTIVIFPVIATPNSLVGLDQLKDQILYLASIEIIIGLIIGFVTRMFFFTIAMAGELIAISLGIGQSQIFNPMMGSMSNSVEQFITFLATLLYLMINGHHQLLLALIDSFNYAGLLKTQLSAQNFSDFVFLFQKFLTIGIQISAPIVIATLIIQLGTGLVSRAVPQINFLTTSVTITMAAGAFIFILGLPIFLQNMSQLAAIANLDLFSFIKRI